MRPKKKKKKELSFCKNIESLRSPRGLLKTKEFHNISGLSGGEGDQLLPHLTRSPTGSIANGRNVRPTRRQISAKRHPRGG